MNLTASNAVYISDLHLFSPRSSAEADPSWIQQRFADKELLVLGGDIFDFRWSRLGSVSESLNSAERWLLKLCEVWSGRIVYLPGNHDCLDDFLLTLDRIQLKCSSFRWHFHYAVFGQTICLHGDVIDAGSPDKLARYRDRFQHTDPQTPVAHTVYDAAVGLRVHRLIPSIRQRIRNPCTALLPHVRQLQESGQVIRDVVFGHTHFPVDGQQVGEYRFHNPGASLRHLTFRPVEFRTD